MAENFLPKFTLNTPNNEERCVNCNNKCNTACLKCSQCRKYIHPSCSGLPAYVLLHFKFSSAQYFCPACLRQKQEKNKRNYQEEIEQMAKLISIQYSENKSEMEQLMKLTSTQEYNENNSSSVAPNEKRPESQEIKNTQQEEQHDTTPNTNQSISSESSIDQTSNYVASPTTFHNHADAQFRRNCRQNSPPFSTPRTGQTPKNNLAPPNSLEYDYDSTIPLQNRFNSLGNMNDFPPLPARPATEKLPDITESKPECNEKRTLEDDSSSSSLDLSTITSAQRSPPKLSIKPPESTTSAKYANVCRFFLENKCKYGKKGEGCYYSHSSGYRNTRNPASNVESDKILCKFFLNNACKYGKLGEQCDFYHPEICTNHLNCRSMECTLFHPTVCKSSQKNLECLNLKCRFTHLKGTKRYKPRHLVDIENTSRTYPNSTSNNSFLEMQIRGLQNQLHLILKHLPFPWWQAIPPPLTPPTKLLSPAPQQILIN